MGATVSLFGFAAMGSSLSLRSLVRLGATLSVWSGARFGSSLSVLDFVHLGSSLSVRTIKATKVSDGTGATYAKFTTNDIELAVWDSSTSSTRRGLTVTSIGGQLHGAWASEATVTTSDRRLKKNIEPLYRTIAAQARDRWNQKPTAKDDALQSPAASTDATGRPPIGWLLRELRPVSFYLKRGPEAKYLKFGFIAQELESVFPNLVRTVGDDQTKAVAMQDLVAVLTLALQSLQKELESHRKLLKDQSIRMERLERAVYATASV